MEIPFPTKNCEKYFQNHATVKEKDKLVSLRQVGRNCSFTVTADSRHECFKRPCNYCKNKQPIGHFCYVDPLKPSKVIGSFLYVFFDTKCTQDFENHNVSFQHTVHLICVEQICSKCEAVDDLGVDC